MANVNWEHEKLTKCSGGVLAALASHCKRVQGQSRLPKSLFCIVIRNFWEEDLQSVLQYPPKIWFIGPVVSLCASRLKERTKSAI